MKFKHTAGAVDGGLTHEGVTYPIVAGVIECPPAVGFDHGYTPLEDDPGPSLIPSRAEYVGAGYPDARYAHFVGRRIQALEAAGLVIPAGFEAFRLPLPETPAPGPEVVPPVPVTLVIEGFTVSVAIEPPVTDDEQKMLAEGHAAGALVLADGMDMTEAVRALRPPVELVPEEPETPAPGPALELPVAKPAADAQTAPAVDAPKAAKSERKRR